MGFARIATGSLQVTGALALSACGSDGGGSVASVSSPPAVNTSLAHLVASQSFANNAATQSAVFNLANDTTTSGSSTSQPLTISYDVGSNSYAISTQGRSQTFAPSAITSQTGGIAKYTVTSGATTDLLTLESAGVTGASSTGPQYSGMGYWQHNLISGSTQTTSLDIFTYGIDTPASAVPRTGQAAYATSVFGLVTIPGIEPRVFQGTGVFNVDFLDGGFVTSASTTETGLISGNSITGGGVGIAASGTLSSTGNTFSGGISYGGQGNSSTGALNGQFYGPNAQELGATFSTTGSDGSAAVGAIWGQQSQTPLNTNLTLTNPVATQLYYASAIELEVNGTPSLGYSASANTGFSQLTVNLDGTVTAGGLSTITNNGSRFTPTPITSSDANFNAYQYQNSLGQTLTLNMYKPGSANSELQLTYMSFGAIAQVPTNGVGTTTVYDYLVYGLNSLPAEILNRTGSASYSGIAYGTAIDSGSGAATNVKGSASFAVNFTQDLYSGSFGLKSTAVDYGTFNVTGTIANGAASQGSITGATAGSGQFYPGFYGPAGEEFGGPFQIRVPNTTAGTTTTIVGAAVAKGG